MMRSVLFVAALIVSLLVFPVLVQAQAPCSLQTITGTYAIKGTGEAFVGQGPGPVPYPSIAGALTPVALVGIVQIHRNGAVTGSFWANSYGQPPMKVESWDGTISLDASCMGDWSYMVELPGPVYLPVQEKIVVLDQGKEIRSVSMKHPNPFVVWDMTARRISGSLVTGGKCRQDMSKGTWVNVCRSYVQAPGTPMVVAMAGMIPLTMDALGNFEGTFYAKMGPQSFETPVEGTVTVHPDCYADLKMVVPAWGGAGSESALVLLDEGKEAWSLLTHNVAPDGTKTPHLPGLCTMFRTSR